MARGDRASHSQADDRDWPAVSVQVDDRDWPAVSAVAERVQGTDEIAADEPSPSSSRRRWSVLSFGNSFLSSVLSAAPSRSTKSYRSGGPDIEDQTARKASTVPGSSPSRANGPSDPSTTKKSHMLTARRLSIISGDGEGIAVRPEYHSRFGFEVARLVRPCFLRIHGQIDTSLLSRETDYIVSLIYKLEHEAWWGSDYQEAKIESYGNTSTTKVSIESKSVKTHARGEGWKKLELGAFYKGKGPEGAVSVAFVGTGQSIGRDIFVEGIEFRPENETTH